jgi:hypothetical protein
MIHLFFQISSSVRLLYLFQTVLHYLLLTLLLYAQFSDLSEILISNNYDNFLIFVYTLSLFQYNMLFYAIFSVQNEHCFLPFYKYTFFFIHSLKLLHADVILTSLLIHYASLYCGKLSHKKKLCYVRGGEFFFNIYFAPIYFLRNNIHVYFLFHFLLLYNFSLSLSLSVSFFVHAFLF